MHFALDPAGRPLFLISNMAMHTQNLNAEPRCSLFVAQANAMAIHLELLGLL
jgi:heme iron utilization protein